MKPIQITLGILIRTLVSIFLVAYFHIAIATALIPNLQIGAIISTIASIIVTAALVTTVVRFQPDNRARYALARSEEHTSELQSLMRSSYAVFCLKKKNKNEKTTKETQQTNAKQIYITTSTQTTNYT